MSGPVRRPLTGGWTLRRKLVASILALFVALTLATGAATVLTLRRQLDNDLDTRVANTVRALPDRDRRDVPLPPIDRGEGLGPFNDGLVVRMQDGAVTRAAASGPDQPDIALSSDQVKELLAAGLSSQPRTLDLGGNLGTYRLAARSFGPADVIIAGLSESQLHETVGRLVLLTTTFGLIGLALVGAGSWWLVGANLRPLRRVADTATRVSRLPLSQGEVSVAERVPEPDTDPRTEVGQVGAALNELLDHVDGSLQSRHRSETQLRQFVADASHELRTPLASIKGYAELSRREREPVPASITHALGRIESESTRMTALVEDLLLLARLDAGRPLERAPVDLTMLTIDAVSDLRVAGPDHHWRLEMPDEAVEAVGDAQRLTQVVVNLLNNARVHTPAGTTVTARVRSQSSPGPGFSGSSGFSGFSGQGGEPVAVLEVEDDGPGIDPELLPRVFSRFTRGDAARTRTQGSTGLGLSIVDAVVAAHGGTVSVNSRPGRTIFTLRLPAC